MNSSEIEELLLGSFTRKETKKILNSLNKVNNEQKEVINAINFFNNTYHMALTFEECKLLQFLNYKKILFHSEYKDFKKLYNQFKRFKLKSNLYDESLFESLSKSMDLKEERRKSINKREKENQEKEAFIKDILKRNGFDKYSYSPEVLMLQSEVDSWKIEFFENKIELYHKNRRHSLKDYHYQRGYNGNYKAIKHVLKFIKKHDRYALNQRYRPSNRMQRLFDEIAKQ